MRIEEPNTSNATNALLVTANISLLIRNNLEKRNEFVAGRYPKEEQQFYILCVSQILNKYFCTSMRKSTTCLSDPKQSVEILKCACEITSEYAMDKWFCTYGNDLLVINKNLILSILLNYDNIHINCIQMRAKILSILSHGCIDFGVVLIRHLVRTLKGQILKENMQSSERLVIASTLIAELCKFNVCPTTVVLELLRSCVKDFRGPNIKISCCIIITCGMYLCQGENSEVPTLNILSTMSRLLEAKALGYSTKIMIEEALYSTRPRDRMKIPSWDEDLIEQYFRHVLRFMRRGAINLGQTFAMLPWFCGQTSKSNMIIHQVFSSRNYSLDYISKFCYLMNASGVIPDIIRSRFCDILIESFEEEIMNSDRVDLQKFHVFLRGLLECVLKIRFFLAITSFRIVIHFLDQLENSSSLPLGNVEKQWLLKSQLLRLVQLLEVGVDECGDPTCIRKAVSKIYSKVCRLLQKHNVSLKMQDQIKYKFCQHLK